MTLIELAIALLVTGVMVGGAVELYSRAEKLRHYAMTYDHMDRIVQALSIYAESAGRIPCPADPSANGITFGWEINVPAASLQVGAGAFPTGSCDSSNNEGIIPFMSLNLSDDIARDGWGHYFTYAVSPQFARSNDQSRNIDGSVNTNTDVGTIHGRCRSQGWVGRYDGHNISAVKARFCCADYGFAGGGGTVATEPWNALSFNAGTDLLIKSTAAGQPMLSPQRDNVNTTVGTGQYQFMTVTNVTTAGNILPVAMQNVAGSRILAPAFVLISHGMDGAGAYLANGSLARYNPPGAGLEDENANFWKGGATGTQKRTYLDGPTNLQAGANYFDDIVRWMTQDSLMAAHGALSCQYP